MAVVNGQSANEDTFNNALASKSRSNTFTGIQGLAHAGSGSSVTNIQQLLNRFLTSLGYSSETDENRDVYDTVAANLFAIANGQNRKAAIVALDVALKELSGRVDELEGRIPSNNFEALIDPTEADDETQGWLLGSLWLNTENKSFWICQDPTEGAAVWVNPLNGESVQANAFYLGDPVTDGTWRLVTEGGNLLVQVRASGDWTTKDEFQP